MIPKVSPYHRVYCCDAVVGTRRNKESHYKLKQIISIFRHAIGVDQCSKGKGVIAVHFYFHLVQ
jgi:hypothetical protein